MIKFDYFIFFILSIVSFIIGVQIGGLSKLKFCESKSKQYFTNYSLILDIVLIIASSILIIANIFLYLKKGTLPILSENPTEAKVKLYTGGFGIIRRINFALSYFALTIPLLKLFHPFLKIGIKKKLYYFIVLFISTLIIISMGSKSSLLLVLNILFAVLMINMQFKSNLFQQYYGLVNNAKIKKWSKRVFILGIVFVFIILFLSSGFRPYLKYQQLFLLKVELL
jgi:hypothetical protein